MAIQPDSEDFRVGPKRLQAHTRISTRVPDGDSIPLNHTRGLIMHNPIHADLDRSLEIRDIGLMAPALPGFAEEFISSLLGSHAQTSTRRSEVDGGCVDVEPAQNCAAEGSLAQALG
jgi:hypothetical protein